jgi:hypothetical protein
MVRAAGPLRASLSRLVGSLVVGSLVAGTPTGWAVAGSLPAARQTAGPTTRLEYVRSEGAERCPARAEVVAAVSARLGHDPFSDDGARVLRCEITRDGVGLRSIIELREATGRVAGARALASERSDCDDLAPAMLLVLSLAARPYAAGVEPFADSPGEPPPSPTTTTTTTTPPPPSPAARRAITDEAPLRPPPVGVSRPAPPALAREPRQPVTWRLGVGALGTAGVGPGLSWGAMGLVGFERGRLSLALEPRVDAPASVAAGSGGRVSFWTASAALVPCVRLGALATCAVVGAGALRGEGQDVPGARTGIAPWISAGARLAWTLPLGPVAGLRAHAEVVALPVRTALRVGDSAVFTTFPVSGVVGLTWIREFH